MKIILVDNFNREGPGHNDKLIVEKICDKIWGEKIVSLLNDWSQTDPYSANFFKLVVDSYKLREWKP